MPMAAVLVDAAGGGAYSFADLRTHPADSGRAGILRGAGPDGASSNGRTADSDSASLGSNPSAPANLFRYLDVSRLCRIGAMSHLCRVDRREKASLGLGERLAVVGRREQV